MCGIIAVLSRPATRPAPEPSWLLERVATAAGLAPAPDGADVSARLDDVAAVLEEVDRSLRGVPGVQVLTEHAEVADAIRAGLATVDDAVAALERWVDSLDGGLV